MASETRKIEVRATGGAHVLALTTAALADLSGGDVLVEVEAAGVNFLDIYQRNGTLPMALPFTPGFEGVGRVRAVGAGVTLEPGTRVAWANALGAYSELVRLPAEQLFVVPENAALRDTLLFQALTAHYLVHEYRSIEPGDTVLVHAAAGGVGQLLVQWSKRRGARVIATASSPEKLELARSLGADVLIDYTHESFAARTHAETGGAGVDLVFDSVGAATFRGSVACLARGGTAISCGLASGPPGAVDVMSLIERAARVAAGSIFAYIGNPSEMQRRVADVLAAIRDGWLHMPEVTPYPLAEAAAAHAALESRKTTGKLVLLPQPTRTGEQ